MSVLLKQFERKALPRAIRLALSSIVCVPLAMPAAQAQQAAAEPAIQRVEITGSNIRRTDKETPSPVQILTVQEMKASGYTTVSEVLRNITANGAGTLSQSFSGAFSGGASGISLRGLTVGATLVLIDGHRMAPYALSDDGQRSFVDISQIPFEAIERIEVLKDGASSVYGSDAVAGVVNVILKKRFVGAELSAEGGTSGHNDGKTGHVSGIYGWGDLEKDGRNAYIALEVRQQNRILLKDRSGDFANTDWSKFKYGPGNSLSGNNLTRGVPNSSNGNSPGSSTGYLLDPDTGARTFLPGCTEALMLASKCGYRDEDLELQPETKNINLMASYTQKLGENWQMNVKGSVFQTDASQIGSHSSSRNLSALAFGPGTLPRLRPDNAPINITVPGTYPGNTTGTTQYLKYNFPELGGRRSQVDSQTVRLVAELNGTWGGWDINASLGHTENTVKQTNDGYFDIPQLQAAFNDPLHPYLVGAAASGNSAAVRAAIAPTQHAKATDVLQFASLRGSRELMSLAGGPLSIGLGAEFTHRELDARAPDAVANGSQVGNNAWAIGNQNTPAAYVELVAPVLKSLELDASLRYDQVNGGNNHSTTPKVGFKYAPVKAVTLRGTYTEGFRAPNPAEAGNTGSYFFANASRDPILCANDGPGDADPAKVAGNFPQQCAVQVGGVQLPGKDLKPETSKSYTLGLILEPSKSFSMSLDYYNIRVNNQIISANSDPSYDPTPFVVRGNPTSQPFVLPDGSIGTATPTVGDRIFSPYPYENALFTKTSGIDLDARYTFTLPNAGKLTAQLTETHMFSYKQGTNGGPAIELAGTHGPSGVSGDTGNPKDRAQFILSYDQGPLKATGTVNWVSSYSVTDPSSASALTCDDAIANGSGAFDTAPPQFCSVKHFTTLDLFASYEYSKKLSFHASILNVFDAKPPLDFQTYGSAASSFYNPALHQAGAVGRFFNFGATYKF